MLQLTGVAFLLKKVILGGGKHRVSLGLFSGWYGRMCLEALGIATDKKEFVRIYQKGKLGRKANGANLIFKGWERREVLLQQLDELGGSVLSHWAAVKHRHG